MSRTTFDRQLEGLVDQVLILGSMVELAIQEAMEALKRRDHAAAQRIYAADQRVNQKRYAIEDECVILIATQQPAARDVRFLAAILEIITELERIGDYAKGISKINLLLGDDAIDPAVISDLQRMADTALDMLRRALDAFVARDARVARLIPAEDDQIDHLYNLLYSKLMSQMIAEHASVDRANHLMWAAHNLERMADRVTNICERIVYFVTGEVKELDSEERIETADGASMDKKAPVVTTNRLPKVLFLCTHNSARSQMAEAFLRKYAGDRFEAYSAGLEPEVIHPLTLQVMNEASIDMSGQSPKGLDQFLGKVHFAYLITVCDKAEQRCPIFPGMGTRLHWSFEDPAAATGSDEEILAKFRQVRDQVEVKVKQWLETISGWG
jgi:phosphate transport system protein